MKMLIRVTFVFWMTNVCLSASAFRSALLFPVGRLSSAAASNKEMPADSSNLKRQHTIQWRTADGIIVFKALDGETLRTAAFRSGVVSPHNGRANLINCRGLGTCGTCAVRIDAGTVEPKSKNTVEQLRLSVPPGHGRKSSEKLRLACQIQIRSDIEVSKCTGFWGQYDQLAPLSLPTQPFGELEFVLDNKSPEKKK